MGMDRFSQPNRFGLERMMSTSVLWTALVAMGMFHTLPTTIAAMSGVTVKILKPSKQTNPLKAELGKTVSVHYTGWLTNGKQFDSSKGGKPFEFKMGANKVIPGWEKALLDQGGMKVGETRKFTIPPELAYGPSGTPDGSIPPNSTLVFEVELLAVK